MLVPSRQSAEPLTTMESSPTYKKATAALDEAARARLRGPFVSDTTPSQHEDVDDGLVDLVDEFYNGYGEHGADVVAKDAVAPRPAEWKDTRRAALGDATADAAAAKIRAEAERAVRDAGPDVVSSGEGIRKLVVERLRASGFDAGLCRSSWERNSSVPAGSHEYVDVMAMGSPTPRYIVEVNVAAEFEIARPSAEYQELLLSLPPVLVATPEVFKEVAAAMCASAAESIRGAGMHVPPWRRARYVQAKWSGQHKRVVGAVATLTGAQEGASTAPAARRPGVPSGGRKHCGMEIGRRGMTVGREGLVSMRPFFRGL